MEKNRFDHSKEKYTMYTWLELRIKLKKKKSRNENSKKYCAVDHNIKVC